MFQLSFQIPKSEQEIKLTDLVYLSGSCFSDEIGSKFQEAKFKALSNPFGTIYNPISILRNAAHPLVEERIIESQEVFYHWDAHSKINGLSPADLLKQVQQTQRQQETFISRANWMILTFGTSHVYELHDGSLVANCHKRPGSDFKKRYLQQQDIIDAFMENYSLLQKKNPRLQVILTVSPVRHVRDGLIENNRSKAILLNAVHQISDSQDGVHYFPSYEIIMDELRDYRFFKTDLTHPSEQAISYIWQRFQETYFSDDTNQILSTWEKIRKSIDHRPIHPASSAHQNFLKKTLRELEVLGESMDLQLEIDRLREQLRAIEG